MPTQIKICGLSTPETIDAAVDAGATHIGMVHFEKSPRHVPLDRIGPLKARIPESVKLVLVTVAMQPEEIGRAFDAARALIDLLKERLPVWKKEIYADGHHWVGEGS